MDSLFKSLRIFEILFGRINNPSQQSDVVRLHIFYLDPAANRVSIKITVKLTNGCVQKRRGKCADIPE